MAAEPVAEDLVPKAPAAAVLAGDIDLVEEAHLDPQDPGPAASLAGAGRVEGEQRRRGTGRPREQGPQPVEAADVGDRGRAAGPPDRRLVDDDGVRAARDQDLVDEGALARPGHAGDHDEDTLRDVDVDVAEVVGAGTADGPRVRPRARRRVAPATVGAERIGHGRPGGEVACRRAGVHERPAKPARPRANLDDMVRPGDDGRIVLDHEHRVPPVPQVLERVHQAVHVLGVQPGTWLVEDVGQLGQVAVELARRLHPLGLAAGERRNRTVEVQVPGPDPDQVPEQPPQLDHQGVGDRPPGRFQRGRQVRQPAVQVGQLHHQRLAEPQPGQFHGEGLGLEPLSVAGRTGPGREVAAAGQAHRVVVTVLELGGGCLEPARDAPPGLRVVTRPVRPLNGHRLGVEQQVEGHLVPVRERRVHVEHAQHEHLAPVPAPDLPVGMADGAVTQRASPVEQQVQSRAHDPPESRASRAGALGIVEAEVEAGEAGAVAAAGEEEAQIRVQLGGSAHRRAQVAPHRFLVDEDGRGEVLEGLDVRAAEFRQALPGERAERLDQLALRLRVHGVDHERRLARARDTREHDEPVVRDVDVDRAQVVGSSAAHDDGATHAGHRAVSRRDAWNSAIHASSPSIMARARRDRAQRCGGQSSWSRR